MEFLQNETKYQKELKNARVWIVKATREFQKILTNNIFIMFMAIMGTSDFFSPQ